jgi:hypothetical protein
MIKDKHIIERGLMVTKADMSDDSGYAKTAYFIKTKYPCQNVASLRMTKKYIGDSEFVEPMTVAIAENLCTAYNETYTKGIDPTDIPELIKALTELENVLNHGDVTDIRAKRKQAREILEKLK